MKKLILREEEKYTVTRRWKKRWYRVTACLAAAVVFCTTYAMILPAVTATAYPSLTTDSAYVDEISVTEIVDGTKDWDADNNPGNDSGPDNKIVRTFDTVTYTFSVRMASYNNTDRYGEARIRLEFVLPLAEKEAVFDKSAMGWMDDTPGYAPVLEIENRIINSKTISCQVLTCYKHLLPSDGNQSVIPGAFQNTVTINVKSTTNGKQIAPEFSACMEHGKWDGTCPDHRKEEKRTVTADTVTVSAAPKYNIQIGGTSSYMDTFDFNTGIDAAPNKGKGEIAGRIFKLGVTLQVYNDNPAKHFKGIELPDGSDITFQLKLTSKYSGATVEASNIDVTDTYTPLLWSADANSWTNDGDTNADGRVLKDPWGGCVSDYAPWTGHDNPAYSDDKTCLDGGLWSAVQNGDTVTVTVKNYKVDVDSIPTKNGSGAEVKYGEDLGIGCFSSGEFWIVQPFNKNNSTNTSTSYDIVNQYGQGAFTTSVDAINMTAKSLGGTEFKDPEGTNGAQIKKNDDSWAFSLVLVLKGQIQNRVAYRSSGYYIDPNHQGVGTWRSYDGKDFAYPGTELYIHSGFHYSTDNNDDETMLYGTNLVRFDPTVFEITGEPTIIKDHVNYEDWKEMECEVYYVTRNNGENWSDEWNLLHSTEENNQEWLKYWDSPEAIPNGWLCIGVLYCFKGPARQDSSEAAYFAADLPVRIRDTATIGNAYATVSTSRVWTKKMFEDAEKTLADLPTWTSLEPSSSSPLVLYFPEGHYASANYFNAPENEQYKKEVYHADGSESTPHNSDWDMWGDTLLIIGYETKITKSLLQETNAGTKTTFNLDSNQRIVDFKLQPSTFYSNGEQINIQNGTTVYVVDTLPKYMTYIQGSAYIGGEYAQTSSNGGTQGTVTGGVLTDPEVTVNEDGTHTLKWALENITVGEAMGAIYYSAAIGDRYNSKNDIPVGTQGLLNKVRIYAKEDMRSPSAENGKYAEASVTAIRGRAYSFGKYTEQGLIEQNGSIDYKVYYDNNSGGIITNMILLDAMPFNGVNESQFNGSYTVSSWKLDLEKCNYKNNLELHYTMDSQYKGIRAVTMQEIAAWQKADIADDGTVTDMNGTQPVAWVITGILDAGKSINVNMQISLKPDPSLDSDKNNIFVNTLSNWTDGKFLTTETTNPTVKRTIEGLTWRDFNADGVQNEESGQNLSGVTVSLWKLKEGCNPTNEESYEPYCYPGTESPITVETGKQISVISPVGTAAADYVPGRYKFTDLPPGSFAVKFEDGSTQKISNLIASPANRGEDDTLDSDGIALYEKDHSALIHTFILNIDMPAANDIQNPIYASNYNDSGFYNRGIELPNAGASGTALFTVTGAVLFTTAAILLIYNRRSYSKRAADYK